MYSKRLRRLEPGDLVEAAVDLDPDGANVKAGQWGVVFGEVNYYGDGSGPIIRWVEKDGTPGGVCNVFDGDIK